MSEYQRIAFRAIDGPVGEKDLQFMRRQSTRAEITPWAFDNEYHWGDFHGDATEMLRRGYDLFLHYANFGVRTLHLRLPYGLPDPEAAAPYLGEDFVQFLPDKRGHGGILAIEPYFEAGELDELWDLNEVLGRLLPLRAEILDGDLRPLYLAHLAIASDGNHDPEETTEAPVPAGLQKPTDAQRALVQFVGLSDSLVAAAAGEAPPSVARSDSRRQFAEWISRQPAATKDEWLVQWMTDPHSAARKELLAEFQQTQGAPLWPTVRPARTIAELERKATEVQRESDRKAIENAARKRAKRLAGMVADPDRTLRKTEELVAGRSREAYHEIATLLAELREALAGSERAGLAERQAQSLRAQNPTLRVLISELRRQGFLPKEIPTRRSGA
ncbi:MAG TPA: hypothetical protein VKD90_27405 [Gemmataceae bacterium]|nr:hypothetical protein [Gemmataceae bacterium]